MVRLYGRTFVTIREAARELGISTTPLVYAIRRKELKVYGVAGTSYLIDLNEAKAWKVRNYSEEHAERVRKRWERHRKNAKGQKRKKVSPTPKTINPTNLTRIGKMTQKVMGKITHHPPEVITDGAKSDSD